MIKECKETFTNRYKDLGEEKSEEANKVNEEYSAKRSENRTNKKDSRSRSYVHTCNAEEMRLESIALVIEEHI